MFKPSEIYWSLTWGSNFIFFFTFLTSVQFSRSIVSDSLPPHELQHARPPCPSQTPGVHSDSSPSSQWCHPAISSSGVPFSSCPQSLPASESFPMSQLFAWGGQSTGVSASTSFPRLSKWQSSISAPSVSSEETQAQRGECPAWDHSAGQHRAESNTQLSLPQTGTCLSVPQCGHHCAISQPEGLWRFLLTPKARPTSAEPQFGGVLLPLPPKKKMCVCSVICLFVTPWTLAHQAPLSMEFSRKDYWSRLLFPTSGDHPNPGSESESLVSPVLAGRFFTNCATWETR